MSFNTQNADISILCRILPLQAKLPGAKAGGEPLPEGLLWLLLTGDVPNAAQAKAVTEELRARSAVPAQVSLWSCSLRNVPYRIVPYRTFV